MLSIALKTFMLVLTLSMMPAAHAAHEKLYALLADMNSLQGEFEQEIYENDQLLEQLSGHFMMRKPAQLYWETDTPDESVLIADGDSLWFYNPFVEQVSVYDQNDAMNANPLLVLLEGDKYAWAEFEVRQDDDFYIIENPSGQGSLQQLRLQFFEGQLSTMIVDDGQGQTSIFSFIDVTLNESIDERWFVPDFPDDVMIDDQR